MKASPRFRRAATWIAVLVCAGVHALPALAADDAPKPLTIAKALSEAYADLYDNVAPSVVGIRTVHEMRSPQRAAQPDADPDEGENEDTPDETPAIPDEILRRFFGEGVPFNFGPRGFGGRPSAPARPRRFEGQGSGVILDTQGHILTNNHVINEATEIVITMADGQTADAEIVARDPETDLAVVKLVKYDKPLHPATIGDSDKVRTGNIVIAIGNPFGRAHSVSSGIVSGKNRTLRAITYERYIQTDAAINPGNSGGPLFNLDGEVIGINTIINTRSGGSVGVGFAVPSNLARNVLRQLIDKGRVTRGWLGIALRDVDAAMRKALPGVAGGALVETVYEGAPAAKGGIRRGDIIIAVNDEATPGATELQERIADSPPNGEVRITVMRREDGKFARVDVPVVLAERTEEVLNQIRGERSNGMGGTPGTQPGTIRTFKAERLGMTLRTMSPRDREQYKKEKGVVVARVDPNGPAVDIGISAGDLIIEIDQAPVADLDAAEKAVAALGEKEGVLLLIQMRGQDPTYAVVPLNGKNGKK